MRLKVVMLVALKSSFVLGLYSSSCIIAMDDKKDLEAQLLPAQPKADVTIEIEHAINAIIEEDLPNKIKDALPASFPPELCAFIHQYAKLSQKEKNKAIIQARYRLSAPEREQEVFNQMLVDNDEVEKVLENGRSVSDPRCKQICMGACPFWLGVAGLIIYFVTRPPNPCHNSITVDASWKSTCWKQRNLQCCYNYEYASGGAVLYPIVTDLYGDHTIFPDSQSSTQLALGDAVSKMAQEGPCDVSQLDVCPEFIDCNDVDKTSPNYYKNFDPCKGLRPISNTVKPSPLTRKIAIARDKQLKSKKRKNNTALAE